MDLKVANWNFGGSWLKIMYQRHEVEQVTRTIRVRKSDVVMYAKFEDIGSHVDINNPPFEKVYTSYGFRVVLTVRGGARVECRFEDRRLYLDFATDLEDALRT